MSDLTRFNRLQGAVSLHDAMNQLLADSFVRPQSWTGGRMPLDLYETEHEFVAKLAVPGLKPDNFDITLEQNVLTIRCHTRAEQQEGVRYHVQEQLFGDFSRSIQFPMLVDADKIQARLADGILTIRVPKAEEAKPKRITVRTV